MLKDSTRFNTISRSCLFFWSLNKWICFYIGEYISVFIINGCQTRAEFIFTKRGATINYWWFKCGGGGWRMAEQMIIPKWMDAHINVINVFINLMCENIPYDSWLDISYYWSPCPKPCETCYILAVPSASCRR